MLGVCDKKYMPHPIVAMLPMIARTSDGQARYRRLPKGQRGMRKPSPKGKLIDQKNNMS